MEEIRYEVKKGENDDFTTHNPAMSYGVNFDSTGVCFAGNSGEQGFTLQKPPGIQGSGELQFVLDITG